MRDLLLELQILINKASLDYKNRRWSRYAIYCTQFNKMLMMACAVIKDITIAPVEMDSSLTEFDKITKNEAYDMLAERVKLKEVLDKAALLIEKINCSEAPLEAPFMVPANAITDVELVCNNFCSVLRELRRRSDHGAILDIETIGDMLYLFRPLLRLYFDAIFEDTWETLHNTSQEALLLPKEKIVLVIKKTRRSITDKELTDDFVQALDHYGQLGDYTTLFYFIYDPDLRIPQPLYLENQLVHLNNSSLNVKIFVRPLS
jgi:hypothetical protein